MADNFNPDRDQITNSGPTVGTGWHSGSAINAIENYRVGQQIVAGTVASGVLVGRAAVRELAALSSLVIGREALIGRLLFAGILNSLIINTATVHVVMAWLQVQNTSKNHIRTGAAVSSASIITENGKPVLKLALAGRLDNISVETTGPAYFHAPRFSSDGHTAWLAVSNLSSPAKLAGAGLRLTYVADGKGYEQTVRIG